MRILIANKFYYERGGDCIYSMNLEKLLKDQGHEVAFFSMEYPLNVPSDRASSFASRVDFADRTMSGRFRAFIRVFGRGDIRNRFSSLLQAFKPDVVHLNNIHSYLSPVLAVIAREAGVRVVWTLHDFKLLCPSYLCLRNGNPCEACFTRPHRVVTHRCMKGSRLASVLAYLESRYWDRAKLERYTDLFICPSAFMYRKMLQVGYPASSLRVLPNFCGTLSNNPLPPVKERQPYYCYVGRLSDEKGIEPLLQAAVGLPYPLVVAGGGEAESRLRAQYHGDKIRFVGKLSQTEVTELLRNATCSVIPSICYENNPLALLESLCCGTPVLGADIGGIGELITPRNGMTYRGGDRALLMNKIEAMFQAAFDYGQIQKEAQALYSPAHYYNMLMSCYAARE